MSWAFIFQDQSERLASSSIKWESYLYYWAIWILHCKWVKHLAKCLVHGKNMTCGELFIIIMIIIIIEEIEQAAYESHIRPQESLERGHVLDPFLEAPWGVTETLGCEFTLWVIWYPSVFFCMVLILKPIRIKVKSKNENDSVMCLSELFWKPEYKRSDNSKGLHPCGCIHMEAKLNWKYFTLTSVIFLFESRVLSSPIRSLKHT